MLKHNTSKVAGYSGKFMKSRNFSSGGEHFRAMAIIGVIVVCLASWIGISKPEWVFAWKARIGTWGSGVSDKPVQLDEHRSRILIGGDGPIMLLLHDFYTSKEAWLDVIAKLPSNYRIVAPDLPGFGSSARHADADYSVMAQTTRLQNLLNQIGSDEVNIVGHGMGADIAASLAAASPERVKSLLLIAPYAAEGSRTSKFDRDLEADQNPMVFGTIKQYERFLEYLQPTAPKISRWEKHFYSTLGQQYRRFNKNVFSQLNVGGEGLRRSLVKVTTPTTILWCDQDVIRDASAAATIQQQQPRANVQILNDCGHDVPRERPAELARIIEEVTALPQLAASGQR